MAKREKERIAGKTRKKAMKPHAELIFDPKPTVLHSQEMDQYLEQHGWYYVPDVEVMFSDADTDVMRSPSEGSPYFCSQILALEVH